MVFDDEHRILPTLWPLAKTLKACSASNVGNPRLTAARHICASTSLLSPSWTETGRLTYGVGWIALGLGHSNTVANVGRART